MAVLTQRCTARAVTDWCSFEENQTTTKYTRVLGSFPCPYPSNSIYSPPELTTQQCPGSEEDLFQAAHQGRQPG